MHYARGLVRDACLKEFKTLENASVVHDVSQVVKSCLLVDHIGETKNVNLVHPGALLSLLVDMPTNDGIEAIREVKRAVQHGSMANSKGPSLYVRGTSPVCADELFQRQMRFLDKTTGKLMASDLSLTEKFTLELAKKSPKEQSVEEIFYYRGIVEKLSETDPAASLTMALNPNLPSIGSGACHALAGLVDLQSASAAKLFVEAFAPKDEPLPACETACTALCVRLRNEKRQDGTTAAMENFFVLNMDPGAVFSGSPVSMLNWAEHSFGRVPLPDRRTAVMQVVQQRRLQPRRVSLDVLSSFCLSDLSREWVSLVLDCVVAEKSPEEATWKSTSEKFVLKNPKRYLVDNRLLRHYAEYMKFGFLSPADECFSAFLDECGECKRAEEMPSAIEFTMDSGRRHASDTLRTVLRSLAPASAYWCAVVDEFPQNIACSVAPMGEVRVVVQLPTINRTADTTTTYRAVTEKPLHEDDAIAVLEKPAGLPTTSHALSPPTSVDLVDVLLHSTKGDIFSSVFRSGVVHRLDADTSGVIVVAKTNHASDGLRHQFGTSGAHSLCSKTYYAVCVVLESLKDIPLKGVLKDPSDPKIRTKFRIVKFEKKSRTALVECRIFQGKKHQIRRHLATLGMPILGDVDHGGAVCVTPLFERVALHASSVTFNHPTTGVSTCVKSPIPSSFLEVFTKST